MDSEKFVYWLQGFVELTESDTISEKQWLVIKDHLKLVLDKKTPSRSESPDRSFEIKLSDAIKPGFNWDILDKQTQWEKWHIPAATC